MAGEPTRKLDNNTPHPIGSGRELRAVANARASAADAPVTEIRGRGERRSSERAIHGSLGGSQAGTFESASEQFYFLPRQSGGMTMFLIAAYCVAAVVFQGLPSTNIVSLGLASATLFACGAMFAGIERRLAPGSAFRVAIIFVGIVLPMTCSGIALAMWVNEGLPWQWAVASMVCINAAAAALFDMRIVSLTGYQDLKRRALFDWSGAPYEILLQKASGDIESISEELRIEGGNDRMNWLVGGYVARDEIIDANRTLLGQNSNVGLIRFAGSTRLATPFNSGGYTAAQMSQAFRTYVDRGDIETKTWSLFANADYEITDTLKVTGGVRYTEDTQDYTGCSRDYQGSMLPNVNVVNRALFFQTYGVLVGQISQGGCVTFDPATKTFGPVVSKLDENNIAWRVALDWKPADNVLLFGSISRGAKAGATPINAANISTQNAPAKQELLTAYEAGVKAGLFERRMQVNVSAFYYDYEDK